MTVEISFLKAGYCTHSGKVAWPGNESKSIAFPATVAVIAHPREGVILFDSGYSERFFEATRRWPYKLYSWITPVFIESHESAKAQLIARGIQPKDVRAMVLSHFHADHIGGVADFPKARYYYHHEAYEVLRGRTGVSALRKAFLPQLLPEDFLDRSQLVELQNRVPEELAALGSGYDLFGDGSVWMIDLPGHTVGHVGLFVRTQSQDYFLLGDACYLKENYIHNQPSHRVANLIMDEPKKYRRTLGHLHDIYQRHQNIRMVPCHCEKTVQPLLTQYLRDHHVQPSL